MSPRWGSGIGLVNVYRGLTPQAINCRPFGAQHATVLLGLALPFLSPFCARKVGNGDIHHSSCELHD